MQKIWIIEDDQNLADLTKLALSKEGYDVRIFHDALNAIEETKTNKPHLILMDISLPGLDGAEAVRILKKEPAVKDIPVIFLTGLVAEDDEIIEKRGLLIDGVNYRVVGKPYEVEHLLKMVAFVLNP